MEIRLLTNTKLQMDSQFIWLRERVLVVPQPHKVQVQLHQQEQQLPQLEEQLLEVQLELV